MDENLHSIDDLFKKAIEENDDVPSPKVWENIDKHLDKKKVISITKKYEKWKWVAAALFIFSTGMAMYTWHLKLRYKEVVKGKTEKSDKTNNRNGIRINGKNNASDSPVTVNAQKQNVAINKTQNSTPAGKTPVNNQNQVAKAAVKNKPASTSINLASTSYKKNAAVKKDIRIATLKIKTKTEKEEMKGQLVLGSGNKKDNKNDIGAKKVIDNSKVFNPDKSVSPEANSTYNASPSAQKIDVETGIAAEPKNLTQVAPPGISSNASSSVSTTNETSYAATTKLAKVKKLNQTKNSISIFFSPGVAATHLQNDLQHFREDDRHEIKQNENNNYTYTIGALVERNITSNLAILSGISLATRITNINSKTLFARPDNRGNVDYRISCSAGYAYISTKRAGGSGGGRPSPGDAVQLLSAKTILQYLSVPAGLRYHLSSGKFSFNPAVALSANFITKKKIETELFAAGGNEKTNTSDIQGLKPAYFDGWIRTDLAYNINRTIGISLIPSARFALSSITKDGPVKTYVNTFGLGLGLNVHF